MVESLQQIAVQREQEVKELCTVYYEDFVQSLDKLKVVREIAQQLSVQVTKRNEHLQGCSKALLERLDDLVDVYKVPFPSHPDLTV
jgi:hypothetical protein